MQTLPVTATSSVAPVQASAAADSNGAAQATEPFGNVLARQRASAGAQDGKQQPDNKKTTTSSANDANVASTGNEPLSPAGTLPFVPDVSGMLPADVLAQSLSASTGAANVSGKGNASDKSSVVDKNNAADKGKPDAQIPAPDTTASALPSEMLAMLLPPAAAGNRVATGEKNVTVDGKTPRPLSIMTVTPGEARQPGGGRTASADVGLPAATDNVKGSGVPEIAAGVKGAVAAATAKSSKVVDGAPVPTMAGTAAGAATLAAASLPDAAGTAKPPAANKPAVAAATVSVAAGAVTTKPVTAGLQRAGEGVVGKEIIGTGVNTAAKPGQFAPVLETSLAKGETKTATAGIEAAPSAMQSSAQPNVSIGPDSLLQSGLVTAANSNGTAQAVQASINTPVTYQAWGDDFSQKITWMATQREQTAELQLNPPNLGPLNVVLHMNGDQASALFTSPHAAVRDAVEQALPRLRDMMADNGIMLGNAMVSDQSPRDQPSWQAGQQQRDGGASSARADATPAIGGASSVASIPLGPRHQGMVDTFV